MPDPPPSVTASYPTAPPPPPEAPGAYPQYPGWQGAPPPQYRGPMLPGWLSFGGILVLVGGILVLIGFVLEAIANSAYASSGAANAYMNYLNTLAWGNVLIGVGIFLAFLGWLFHQMSRHRMMGGH